MLFLPPPMAAVSGSSSAATALPSSARLRRSTASPPSQLSIPSKPTLLARARFSLNPKCDLVSNNSVPKQGIASKPSPLEMLKTSGADRYTKEKSSIIAIGLNIHTAPVEIREKFAIPEAQRGRRRRSRFRFV